MKLLDVLGFIKELLADNEKMGKFREIVADIKELISDIKGIVSSFTKLKV